MNCHFFTIFTVIFDHHFMKISRYLLYISMLFLAFACGQSGVEDRSTIYVSIAPLKGLVASIVEDDFEVQVLVPSGASPETFEPSARQLAALHEAQWVFQIGLIDFETTLLDKLNPADHLVSLHDGVELIAGSCTHGHHHHGAHAHGVDPHIWTSPRALQQMASSVYETIRAAYPDSVRYTANYERLLGDLRALDRRVEERIAASGITRVVVYHPALTYYARDYGIRQDAIEQEGKEPSARQLATLIREAREAGVRAILYQRQYPRSVVETVAADIGAEAVEFDPLAEDVMANIDHITDLITQQP